MTIPLSDILPWIVFAILAAPLGFVLWVFSSAPNNLTGWRYSVCFALVYVACALWYATKKGWLIWV